MEALRDDTYRNITALMYDSIGLSFNDSKKSLVSSRLAPRIQRLGIDGYEDYLALIGGPADSGEFQMAIDLLTTNETYFFREPAHYDLLEQELTRTKPRLLSVWSAASSFGDEAFSTAMLLADMAQQGRIGSDWRILGTDISDRCCAAPAKRSTPRTGWATSRPSGSNATACAATARRPAWCRCRTSCVSVCASASSTCARTFKAWGRSTSSSCALC